MADPKSGYGPPLERITKRTQAIMTVLVYSGLLKDETTITQARQLVADLSVNIDRAAHTDG